MLFVPEDLKESLDKKDRKIREPMQNNDRLDKKLALLMINSRMNQQDKLRHEEVVSCKVIYLPIALKLRDVSMIVAREREHWQCCS